MRLSHNLASLNIYKEQTKNIKAQSKAMQRISSGIKVNNSADGANEIAQSEKLRMQIRGMQMAQRNSQDGMSMLQTAEGALDTTTQMLQRIRELTVQAGGVNSTQDNILIQNEIEQMKNGINDTVNNCEFNGVKLLNGTTGGPLNMTVGANTGDTTKIPTYDLTSGNLGLGIIDVRVPGGLDTALGVIDKAIGSVLDARGKYGALENRFESTYDRSVTLEDAVQMAESNIRDADISKEMIDFSRTGILIEVGNALMAQTNRFPQDMLKILDNVRG